MKKPEKKKKASTLLSNILGGERRRHQVAMITEEAEWNQQESNSGMARVFVIMLLLHVVLIGGIIIYDFTSTEVASPPAPPVATKPTTDPHELSSTPTPQMLPEIPLASEPEVPVAIPVDGTHTVQSGDSLPSIAARNGVDPQELIAVNQLENSAVTLTPGTVLKLPAHKVAAPAKIAQVKAFPEVQPTEENSTPPVVPAEPVSLDLEPIDTAPPAPEKPIAQEETPVEKPIVQAETPKEKPAPPAPSKPSGSYKPTPVPTTKPTPPPPAPEPKAATRSHVMAKGDTLFSLARKYGVTVQAIQDANGIKDPTKIQTNSRLIIPASK